MTSIRTGTGSTEPHSIAIWLAAFCTIVAIGSS